MTTVLTVLALVAMAVIVVWFVSAGVALARQGRTDGSSFAREFGSCLAFTWRNAAQAVDDFIDDWMAYIFLATLAGILITLIALTALIADVGGV